MRDWYPYYAGFTERFVDAVIAHRMSECRLVLDPWSGSGTTTVACLRQGIDSKGIDINPALTVVARARLNPMTARCHITRVAKAIVEATPNADFDVLKQDLLELWMSPSTVALVRRLQAAIHAVLQQTKASSSEPHLGTDGMSPMVSFFYCALFGAVRAMLRRFWATNPTWLKYPATHRHRVRPSWLKLSTEFQRQVEYLSDRLSLLATPHPAERSPFNTGTATKLEFDDGVFDGVVTSPPYATRVDYVRGTLPELALLGADRAYVEALRSSSTGSPKVKGSNRPRPRRLWSDCAVKALPRYCLPQIKRLAILLLAVDDELLGRIARRAPRNPSDRKAKRSDLYRRAR